MDNPFFDYPDDKTSASDAVFLEDCDDKDWDTLLSFTVRRDFAPGETILRRGEKEDAFYFLADGEVEVLIEKRDSKRLHQLTVLGTGSIIGEQGFLDGAPRSATICALKAGTLLRMSHDGFDRLAARHPRLAIAVLKDLGRILSLRLRNITATVSSTLV